MEEIHPIPIDRKTVLTADEAAAYLGVSRSTLARARMCGNLFGVPAPAFVHFGRTVRYMRVTIDDWLMTLPTKTRGEEE